MVLHEVSACRDRQMAGTLPNLHTMVPSPTCIQGVLKVKVEGHVIRTLLWSHENRFFFQANGCVLTKLSLSLTFPTLCPFGFLPHSNTQMAVSLRCEFRHSSHGETVCQTVCYTVRSDILYFRDVSFSTKVKCEGTVQLFLDIAPKFTFLGFLTPKCYCSLLRPQKALLRLGREAKDPKNGSLDSNAKYRVFVQSARSANFY